MTMIQDNKIKAKDFDETFEKGDVIEYLNLEQVKITFSNKFDKDKPDQEPNK